jgi:protein ImuA
MDTNKKLDNLRAQIEHIERPYYRHTAPALPFGVEEIDKSLRGGGLSLGALHDVASSGIDTEFATTAALFVGSILARTKGTIMWILQTNDIYMPGLTSVGVHPGRIIFVEAGKQALWAMEECLHHGGLAAVVCELFGRLDNVASRRLQLAAESTQVPGFLIRRSRKFNDSDFDLPSAAVTRWRISTHPSPAPLANSPETPGLGPATWRLSLTRCKGGEPKSWTVRAPDQQGRLLLLPDTTEQAGSIAAAS